MPLEESGVNLVVEGLASFLGGLAEGNDAIGDLANTAAGVGAAGFSALGDAASAVGDVVAGAFTAALAVGVAGIAALAGGIAYGIGQAIEAEAAVANLNRMIVNLGEDAPITTQGALDLAAQFQGLALGSDDAVLAIIDLGVKSRNISEEEFPAFIQASLDLGAVMGDNATAARLLARAQEDPLGVLGPLRRQGILFTEEQEAQIKTLQASGDVAGAYAIVMEQVGAVTGGAALTNTQTLSGMIETFKNTISEAWEEIGTAFLPALHAIGEVMMTTVIPAITSLAGTFATFADLLMQGNVGSALVALREGLTSVFGPEVAGAITQFLAQLVLGFQSVYDFVIANWPLIQSTFQTVFGAIGTILTSVGGFITGTLIPALTTIWASITEGGPSAQEIFTSVMNALSTGATAAAAFVTDTLVPALTAAVDWIVLHWPEIQATIETVFNAISDVINNIVLPFINETLIPAFETAVAWVVEHWPEIQAKITEVINAVDEVIRRILTALAIFWTEHGESIKTIVTGMWTAISETFTQWMTDINTDITNLFNGIKTFWATWGDEISAFFQTMLDGIGTILDVFALAFELDWTAFGENLVVAWGVFWEDIKTTINEAITAIQDIDWAAIGTAIMEGVAQGIRNGAQFIIDAAWEAAMEAFEAAKRALGISSPSKLFEDIGKNTMEGFAQGVKDNTSIAKESVATAMIAATQPAILVPDRAATSPTTINNYNTADIDIHGANVGRNRQTVTDDVLLGLQLGFGLST